jgi:ligand-binding sensor domain-containing protein/serine phosphatase RsbU (regulator of sigma subunit)
MVRRNLICLMLVILLSPLMAQTYSFRNFSDEEGLPQSYIYSISQNKDGFLNLSTGTGFCTFDGNSFKNNTVKDGLSENFVTTHFTDSRGILWLGHFQSGISFMKGTSFHKLKSESIQSFKVNQFVEDKEKNLWVATQGGGVYMINSEFKLIPFTSTGSKIANSICFDREGNLLVGSPEGLEIYNPATNRFESIGHIKELKGKSVKSIVRANQLKERFWLSVENEGVYGIEAKGKSYKIFKHFQKELNSDAGISSMLIDKSGNLWLGLFGNGLRKISYPESKFPVVTSITRKNGLMNEYIQSIYQDFEGNMWFGTFGGGLIEKTIDKFSFYTRGNGIPDDQIHSVLISRKGELWMGSDSGLNYVVLSDPRKNKFFDSKNGFVNDQVNSLLEDRNHNIWIGTENNGIIKLDPKKLIFENFSKQKKLEELTVNSIVQDEQDNLAFGTNGGIYFYNLLTDSMKWITTLDGLLHNHVLNLFFDSKQRLWICSHGAAPYYLYKGQFTTFKYIEGLRSFYINSVSEDQHGIIWIATEGDGVFRYDGKEFKHSKSDNGLLSNYCYGVIVDKNNSVWVTHKNGLSEKKFNFSSFRSFTKSDGLLLQESNYNSCTRDSLGNLWFGTNQGLIHFNSESEKNYKTYPKISISGIKLNNKFYSAKETITKSYGSYATAIDFIAVSFTDPAKVKYKYRLLGLDSIWRFTTNRFVEYSRLNDGNYIFQLMACNNEGIWTLDPAQVQINIGLPIWKKVWFYFIILIFLMGCTYMWISWKTSSLKRTQLILEQRVREKTHLLQQEKETVEKIKVELETKNKDITDSINYAKRIQEALLPARKSILEKLPDSFIYYKPRDIVSGDFYWFGETQDHYIIAVVDCTGHGVPGAFMSLIGYTLLNQIVSETRLSLPSKILNRLNEKILQILHQEKGNVSTNDGMDMAICRIDKKKSECVFAGALRPLYIVRNTSLEVLKGDSFSIGGHIHNEKHFTDHYLQLEKGDMLYLFSDGYADQFNARNNKKFTSRRFKDLLTYISGEDPQERERLIERNLEDWKGPSEQVDDILVIGITV